MGPGISPGADKGPVGLELLDLPITVIGHIKDVLRVGEKTAGKDRAIAAPDGRQIGPGIGILINAGVVVVGGIDVARAVASDAVGIAGGIEVPAALGGPTR